jgi:hypothetical protein
VRAWALVVHGQWKSGMISQVRSKVRYLITKARGIKKGPFLKVARHTHNKITILRHIILASK